MQDEPEKAASEADRVGARRVALRKIGLFGAYTAPVMVAMLTSEKALAQSGGSGFCCWSEALLASGGGHACCDTRSASRRCSAPLLPPRHRRRRRIGCGAAWSGRDPLSGERCAATSPGWRGSPRRR